MPVDTGQVLHVLAHELRTPAGIAQGYTRMLLEDRLADPADRQRALEQIHKALARIAELSNQSSALAGVLESPRGASLFEFSIADVVTHLAAISGDAEIVVRAEDATTSRIVRSYDKRALLDAVETLVRVTTRELRHSSCTVHLVTSDDAVDFFIGSESDSAALAAGPRAPAATALELERGGVGLSLVHAAVVLEKHDGECWTVGRARNILGVRLPLNERAHP